jgi:hypothetical protein
MSYASSTGAQRVAVNTAANKLAKGTQASREGFNLSGVSNDADVEALGAATAAALAAIGITSAIASNQKLITTAVKFPCGAVTGTGTFATATIVNGVVTGIVLSAS